jgi:ATP-dependent RNA helicase DHX36
VKLLELGSCAAFLGRLLDPPDPRALQLSLDLLQTINAIKLTDSTEELTPLGYHLAQLPLDPQTGMIGRKIITTVNFSIQNT